MKKTIFILVKARIRTTHKTSGEAIKEIQNRAKLTVTDTQQVKIEELKMMDSKLK